MTGMAETGQLMVIHHAHRLEEGINDGRSHELHPPAFQILGDFVGQIGAGMKNIIRIQNDFPIRKAPEIAVKGAKLLLDGKEPSLGRIRPPQRDQSCQRRYETPPVFSEW